jgi:hypothetical protein
MVTNVFSSFATLTMEALCFSETSVTTYKSTGSSQIPKLNSHGRENLNSYNADVDLREAVL